MSLDEYIQRKKRDFELNPNIKTLSSYLFYLDKIEPIHAQWCDFRFGMKLSDEACSCGSWPLNYLIDVGSTVGFLLVPWVDGGWAIEMPDDEPEETPYPIPDRIAEIFLKIGVSVHL